MPATDIDHERLRLDALKSYSILDTPPDIGFDEITSLAASIFNVPIVLVSLVDADRQWFKSKVGMDDWETPRAGSFCNAAIQNDAVMVVPDATQDPRYQQHPLVTGDTALRFYAAAPLQTAEGFKIGTLCLMDHTARELTEQQRATLTLLSNQVVNLLALHKKGTELADAAHKLEQLNRGLREAESTLRESEQRRIFALDAAEIGDWNMDLTTNVAVRSLRHDQCFGYTTAVPEWGYDTFLAHVHPADRERVNAAYTRAMGGQGDYDVEFRVVWPDGTEHWLWSRGSFYFDASATPIRVAGIQADITLRKQTETQLRRNADRTRHLLRAANIGLWEWDLLTNEVYFSPEWKGQLGYADAEIPNRFDEWQQRVHPEDLKGALTAVDDFRSGRAPQYSVQIRLRHRDGSWRWIYGDAQIERNDDGEPIKMMGSQIDITHSKQTETELLRFKGVLDNTLDMIFMFEPESLRFVYVNHGAVISMGYSEEELLGMTPHQIKPLMPEPQFRKLIEPLLSEELPSLRFETVHRRKDGTDFPVAIFLQLVRQNDGSRLFVAIMHDISEQKKSEELIWKQANFDNLTGLPNRRMFHDRLEQEIKKPQRSGLPMALLLLDLDHFKEVNDTLGHAQGDVLLMEAARRITECVRESDTVARLGGDEFTVVLSEMGDVASIERITQNIIERLAAPFQLLQQTVYVSVSVGITLYPDDANDIDTLIKNADQAMYLSKNSGRNRFSYFTAALQEAAQTRLRLLSDLRAALASKQLAVHYQPIVDMASGQIYKAEALLRWKHPALGMVSPIQFIPLAEESGLIHEIGDWVFLEATRELQLWREKFVPEFQISVNVSPVQFRKVKADSESSWVNHLRAIDLPGESLVIEITEGLLLAAETNVNAKLVTFSTAGIQVALDDFGTGYSSLSYLKKFDIDFLKIDQSFVRNLQYGSEDKALCKAIIVMAHTLGLKVIAEGVETEQQRDLLAGYGCDYAQGWLYSKAIPAVEFEALLREQAESGAMTPRVDAFAG